MKCYVTELESHVVLGGYPVSPMIVFHQIMLNDEQRAHIRMRHVEDVREEIIVTDDRRLLDIRFECDAVPVPLLEPIPSAAHASEPAPSGDAA